MESPQRSLIYITSLVRYGRMIIDGKRWRSVGLITWPTAPLLPKHDEQFLVSLIQATFLGYLVYVACERQANRARLADGIRTN